MIILNSSNAAYILSMTENVKANELMEQDPISFIDFNIYEEFFIHDYQKVYCSAKDPLIEHIQT